MNPLKNGWLSRAGLINLLLRSATLGSRAILILFLAKYLSPADLGIYSLLAATVYLSVYAVGLDFYSFATRELLATGAEHWPAMLRDQAVLHLCVYAAVLPALLGLFFLKLLPWEQVAWFYVILLGEHVAQELYRLLLTASKSVQANMLHFCRAGAWVYLFVGLAKLRLEFRTTTFVLLCWLAGLLAGILVAASRLRSLEWHRVRHTPIDWGWIRRGSLVSCKLLCGTLALWAIPTLDRYFLARYWGTADVGVYSFFTNPALTIVAFVEACIIAPAHADLILRSRHISDKSIGYLLHFTKVLIGWTLTFCLLAAFGLQLAMHMVGRAVYSGHLELYWILSLFAFVSIVSRPPHYVLYAHSRDLHLVASSVAGLLTAIVLNIMLTQRYGTSGAAWATAISMCVVLVWKGIAGSALVTGSRRLCVGISV